MLDAIKSHIFLLDIFVNILYVHIQIKQAN